MSKSSNKTTVPTIERWEAGKKFGEVFCDANWSDTGTTSAVRNAKSLVQIEMTDICANVARPTKTDLRVHVCAIHINLAAVRMNDVANLADGGFENAVG